MRNFQPGGTVRRQVALMRQIPADKGGRPKTDVSTDISLTPRAQAEGKIIDSTRRADRQTNFVLSGLTKSLHDFGRRPTEVSLRSPNLFKPRAREGERTDELRLRGIRSNPGGLCSDLPAPVVSRTET